MSNDIRKYMNLMEAPEWERDEETGRVNHPDVSYEISPDKAIANLKSYNSQSYTKLAQKLERIKQLSEEVDQLKEEVKAETKDGVADLFAAEDAARTRIVETVSFIFQLSKNPKETVTPKYKDILEELSKSMTPELIKVMEGLKKTMVTTVQKSPTLKVSAKESVMTEGVWDALKGYLAGFLAKVQSWGKQYDSKLAALKAQAATNESVDGFESNESELDEYAQASSTPEAYINIITLAVQHGRLHQAEMELDDFRHTHPEAAEQFIASEVGQHLQSALAEGVAEGIDYNRVDRIEKQVDFMAGRGRSREEIVANITSKMGNDEGEHAATYFDTIHGVSEDAVRSFNYDPNAPMDHEGPYGRGTSRPGKDDKEGRSALAKEVKAQRSRHRQDATDNNTSRNSARGAASGSGNYYVDRRYKPGHKDDSPWVASKRVKETMEELDISESDLDSSEDRLMREYEEMMETMAFQIGQTVYCGSRAGKVLGPVDGVPDAILVELPNGEQAAFKKKDCSNKKPGLMKKAAHWMVGEEGSPELALAGDEAHAGNKPDAEGKLWLHSYKEWIDHSKYFAGAKPSLSGHEITAYDTTGNRKMAGMWDLQGRKGWIDTNLYAKYKMKEDEMEADGDEAGLTEWDDEYTAQDAAHDDAQDRSSASDKEAIKHARWGSGDYDIDVPFTSLESLVKFIQLDFADEKLTSMDDVAELFDNDWAAVSQAKTIVVRGDGSYCYKGDGGNFNDISSLPKVLQDKLGPFVEKSKEDAIADWNESGADFDDAGRGYGNF